jgi:hypothetical protein
MTPPTSCLCLATRVAVQSWISLGDTLPFDAGWMTTYARGHSSSSLQGFWLALVLKVRASWRGFSFCANVQFDFYDGCVGYVLVF